MSPAPDGTPSPENPLRLAMWSGPRNVSTALMRSWERREDTAVCDEPFYAYYLLKTGVAHPGAEEVIRTQETDWRKVVESITGPVPGEKSVFYQKHMSHHLLPELGEEWLPKLFHSFLIRDPREMLLSLDEKFSHPRLEDTGLPQQLELFEMVRKRTGKVSPVVDAKDLLLNPRGVLELLCKAAGVPFTGRMLSWPRGRRPTDGVWAKHWYQRVEESTGFAPYRAREGNLPPHLLALYGRARECYESLHAFRLKP
jgi:hypothetical protein